MLTLRSIDKLAHMRYKTACGCSIIWVSETIEMPNKHLEHPEDSILQGRKVAIDAIKELVTVTRLSVKWDGAPAIVFGTNPENGKFFVGTKSVFNKRKIKINYSHEDIDQNHQGTVGDILRLAFDYLPRINRIIQADWIGVGGGSVYTPNTIQYKFATPISQQIILAPHTEYTELSPTAEGKIGVSLESTPDCYFVDTNNATVKPPLGWRHLAKILPTLMVAKVPQSRTEIAKHINSFVRNGTLPHPKKMYDTLDAKYKGEVNVQTFKVWHMIFQLKQRLLDAINVNGTVECYIDGKPSRHEGFVTCSDTPLKIVDRLTFSQANFNLSKNWTNEKV